MSHRFLSIQTSAFSGATLLAFLLNSHPEIVSIGEMNGLIPREDPAKYLCSCGEKIEECRFWSAVCDTMNRQGFEFDTAHFDTKFSISYGSPLMRKLETGSFRSNTLEAIRDGFLYNVLPQRHRMRERIRRNVALIESVLAVTKRSVFVDSSKEYLRPRYLQRFSELEVRVIHLYRDIRGYVASRRNRDPNLTVERIVSQWLRENRRILRTLEGFSKSERLVVSYEDLCADPRGVLSRIFRLCGVDPESWNEDCRASPNHIVGNPMRLKQSSEIAVDERWKELLTRHQCEEIERIGGAFHEKLRRLAKAC
jgi:hypothetical protein